MAETTKFGFYLPVDGERGWAARARAAFTKIDLLLGALLNADGSVGHGHAASDITGLTALLTPKLEEVKHDSTLLGKGTAADPLRFNPASLPPAPEGGLRSVARDASLKGNGTAGSPLGIARVEVGTTMAGEGTAASPLEVNIGALNLPMSTRIVVTSSNQWAEYGEAYEVYAPPPAMAVGGYAIPVARSSRLLDGTRDIFGGLGDDENLIRGTGLSNLHGRGYRMWVGNPPSGRPPDTVSVRWLVFEPR